MCRAGRFQRDPHHPGLLNEFGLNLAPSNRDDCFESEEFPDLNLFALEATVKGVIVVASSLFLK
jgi:hypothetical protein